MIPRYTRDKMGAVWSLESRFEKMKQVELAVAKVQSEFNLIPKSAYKNISKKASFNIKKIERLEESTKHDVVAFVQNLSQSVGAEGRYIHFGLTSSDVLDTALGLQIKEGGLLLLDAIKQFKKILSSQIKKNKDVLCVGRTHGMHAEVTSLGYKFLSFLKELKRNEDRLKKALLQASVGQVSGPVGTYSLLDEKIEKKVCALLKLQPETVSTQVVPRDRYAHLLNVFSLLGAGLERVAVELRHLQRTEVAEVTEGFAKGQKGSSAMPHKKNPISAENITGLSRLLRSYAQAGMENIALWHERDISHSSVERVILPDAFILCDYLLHRSTHLFKNLIFNQENIKKNILLSRGQVFSACFLAEMIKKGWRREVAYDKIQKLSFQLLKNPSAKVSLLSLILKDKDIMKDFSEHEVKKYFSEVFHKKRLLKLVLKKLSIKN